MFGIPTQILSIFTQVGPVLSDVRQKAAVAADLGALPSKDDLAELISEKLHHIDPRIAGDQIISLEERTELARGFAGIIRRMIVAERK